MPRRGAAAPRVEEPLQAQPRPAGGAAGGGRGGLRGSQGEGEGGGRRTRREVEGARDH